MHTPYIYILIYYPLAAPAAHAPLSPKAKLKPPVPARDDVPLMGLMSDKDWIVTNAVEAIAGKPQPAKASGAGSGKLQDINYTQRPGFGKVGRAH